MSSKQRVFVMLSRVPWPLEKGDKLRAWHQLVELSHECELCVFCLSDAPVSDEALAQLKTISSEVHVFRLRRMLIVWRLFLALFSSRPFQVHYFYQRAAARMVEAAVERFKPDHIYCQLIRCSEYVKHIHHISKTLDYMDAFNKGMERRAAQSKGIQRWFLLTESQRLVKYENLIFDYFDHHTIISEQDRKLIYHPERHRIAVIPNGVDTDYFACQTELTHEPVVVFTGNMSYPPNVDTAELLAREVFPKLRTFVPQARLVLAGADPSLKVKALAQLDGVEVTGWLNDIRTAYRRGSVFAAPLRIGTGLQNKLLEAMSMGLPCVTTTLANNALQAEANVSVLIADSAEGQAHALAELLTDRELRDRLRLAGRSFVKANYSWRETTRKLIHLMQGKVSE
jgi:sugar transferase (PEP-CTERM/EpsH1 system associated)